MELNYQEELTKAMTWLGKQKDTIFLGQTVEYPGSPMFSTLENVPKVKRIEMPLIEDDQMGISIGLALDGYIPLSVYPRMDFLIIAMNQIVNQLDKIEKMSNGEFRPGVIVRTMIGNTEPLWPGLQHCGDYEDGLMWMTENISIIKIEEAHQIPYVYKEAYKRAKNGKSSIIIEMPQGATKEQWEKNQNAGGIK